VAYGLYYEEHLLLPIPMLKNYFKIALRTLRKRPGTTLINVGGLGLGLACCFLIVLFIQHERSFDGFHENGDRIVRLTYTDGEGAQYANSSAGFAPLIEDAFPEVEHAIRIENFRSPFLRLPDGTVRKLDGLALADDGFFEAFSFPLLRGDAATALDGKYTLVLTETAATSLFGNADPVGQTVQYDDFDLTVTGVMADPPDNSHLRFGAVAPFRLVEEFMGEGALTDFTNINYATYLLLRPGTDAAVLDAKITAEVHRRLGEEGEDVSEYAVALQPLSDIYFNTTLAHDNGPRRDPSTLWTFGAIGVLILLIACVNFMNLATARAGQRAREVGVRKAIGAQKGQLVGQFLGESVLLSVLAIALGIVLAAVALPFFNDAIGATATLDLGHVVTLLLLVGIGLGAGLIAGSYPAFYLSSFRPARVLKGEADRSGGALWLRKGLIVFQFAVSAFLIVATLTVYDQLQFMQGRDLGFEKEQVVFINPPPPVWQQMDAFADELTADANVLAIASSGGLPGRTGTNRGYNWPGQAGADEQGESFWTIPAGPGYLDVLGIDLLAGRFFSEDVPTDTLDTYVLNETAVRTLGLSPEEAVGASFRAWDRPMGQIIGVTEDFHFQSLHQAVEPLVMNYIPWFGIVSVRTAPGGHAAALDHVRATWDRFAPGYAFDYRFLDEDFDRLYRDEARLGQLFGFFAGVAIFIACLGLFGLAAYTAERRRKEIGVRKVMGASVPQIVRLLAGEFARLVLVGFVLAVPVAYVVMNGWLGDFAYRIGLGPGVFLLAGGIALLIALAAVSGQALRAATTDPVKAIRTE
jgi:putative ABC transport system permease protein